MWMPYLISPRLYASRQIERGAPGNIINISSAAGFVVSETSTAYSVSKAAVVAMTKALALELSPYKIRVNGHRAGLHIQRDDQ